MFFILYFIFHRNILSIYIMMVKLNKYNLFMQTLANGSKVHGKKTPLFSQRKHLSGIVPSGKKFGAVKEKLYDFLKWYDEFTGMDEVRKAQKRVLENEEKFRASQEERRSVVYELKEIQSKLKEVYAELDSTNRGEDRYVQLVTQEHKLLKEEKIILDKFTMAEKTERDSFAALSSSVKISHEKERAQSERTKYWSIIGSVMGTVLGIVGTSVNNYFKMNELKELIKNSSDIKLLESLLNNYLENSEKIFRNLKEENMPSNSLAKSQNELLQKINDRLSEVEISLKDIEKCNKNQDVKDVNEITDLAEIMKKDIIQTKMLLFTLAVLSIIMPIITSYS